MNWWGGRDRLREEMLKQLLLAETRRADAAEARESYWRTRCEKFIDQVALRQGIIAEPSMREVPPPPQSAASTAFGALATTEINGQKKKKDTLAVSAVAPGVITDLLASL